MPSPRTPEPNFQSRTLLACGRYTMDGGITIIVSGNGAIGVLDNDGTTGYNYNVKITGGEYGVAERLLHEMKETGIFPSQAKL